MRCATRHRQYRLIRPDMTPGIAPPIAANVLPALAAVLTLLFGIALSMAVPPTEALAQVTSRPGAQPPASAGPQDPRWAAIRRVFGQDGKAAEGYFRIELPRSDLHVRIGDVTLETPFELTTYFGFAPVGEHDVLAMGEVIMVQEEVNGALLEARSQGVDVTALHNHLIGETPRIIYLHVMTQGPAEAVATRLHSVASKTRVPLQPAQGTAAARRSEGAQVPAGGQRSHGAPPDWSAIDAILGPHAEAEGMTASYIFPRREPHSVHGVPVRSTDMIETASEVVFQQLPGGRMACGGELYLRPEEVQPVIDALEAAGLHVTALHNHMLDEQPHMYWLHWFGTGEGTTMARGVAAAISKTNSERRSELGG